ncbi:uncharacterized protein LOC143845407 [Tasmannia lanceolata]|uniref:uncharacterized protein LOC143845407 n=1 Tax=Tasmannia lanceolata TaxID=3420 RepID=UPI004064999C
MPRPGPRPYECVRRAWHSDRHQPMRGSLIQEIFKVVNEIHSLATKKNKEWQEKIPVVVLKAEEIMYSKANSEAEYMDLKTLRERTDDAINTIIRRDESTETGDLLQPCIEAALTLGCVPRRASRSQRHTNPWCYLTPSMPEATETSGSPKIAGNTTYGGTSHLLPPHSGSSAPNPSPQFVTYDSTIVAPTAISSTFLGTESTSTFLQHKPIPPSFLPGNCREFPLFSENFRLSCQDKSSLPMETYPSPSSGRVYPLYYSTSHQAVEPHFSFQNLQHSNSNAFSRPFTQLVVEGKTPFLRNLLGCDNAIDASTRTQQSSNLRGTSENPPERGYDLSLRLGLLPTPSLSTENSWTLDVEDVGSGSFRDWSRYCDVDPTTMKTTHFYRMPPSPRRDKEFNFFPIDTADGPLESGSSKWSSEGQGEPARKCIAPTSSFVENGQFCWQPKPSTSQIFGRMKGPSS